MQHSLNGMQFSSLQLNKNPEKRKSNVQLTSCLDSQSYPPIKVKIRHK